MKSINIKSIRVDGGTQSRVEINNDIVSEYAALIKDGAEFPPVVVFNDGADNWLADGFHREQERRVMLCCLAWVPIATTEFSGLRLISVRQLPLCFRTKSGETGATTQ